MFKELEGLKENWLKKLEELKKLKERIATNWEKFKPIAKLYFRNNLIGIDQLINCWFGGAPDETMSSRLARYKDNPYGRPFYLAVNWVFEHVFRWPNHCEDSKEPDDRHKDEVLK